MRSVILQEFVSIDGMAAGPDDSVDFIPAATEGDQSFGRNQLDLMDTIDAILLGRVTYEMFVTYWPEVKPGDDDEPFADKLNAIPKIVFSKTLERAPWGTWDDATVIRSDAAQEVRRLKQGSGGNMVIWGSISLARSLLHERLIDEVQLLVCPVVLGKGKRLFSDSDSLQMQLRRTSSFDRGTVLLAYSAS